MIKIKYKIYPKEVANKKYYADIMSDEWATFTKLIDRYHNLTTMGQSFSPERKLKYTQESKKFVYPLCEFAFSKYPQYDNSIIILQRGITSIVNSTESCLITLPDYDNTSRKRIIA